MYEQINIDCEIKQKITWFHFLARNKIFPSFTVTSHQPHLANKRWSCLEVQIQASGNSNVHLANILENCCITAWFDVPSTPTIPSSSFVVDIDGYFVTSHHLVFRQLDCLPTHKVTLESQVASTKYMKQSFKTL